MKCTKGPPPRKEEETMHQLAQASVYNQQKFSKEWSKSVLLFKRKTCIK